MSDTTRPWSRPSIVALSRGTPAESTLEFCKLFSPLGGAGSNAAQSGCWTTTCNTACLAHHEQS